MHCRFKTAPMLRKANIVQTRLLEISIFWVFIKCFQLEKKYVRAGIVKRHHLKDLGLNVT